MNVSRCKIFGPEYIKKNKNMYILEIIPILLAIVAIFVTSIKLLNIRRKTDYIICTFSIVASLLLIFAQTSWWVSMFIDNNLEGTSFSNKIWFMFNTIVMLILILNNTPRKIK